jgi:hypothetical protein
VRSRLIVLGLGAALFAACENTEPPSCPSAQEILPAAGNGAAQTGALVPQGDEQFLTIPAARDQVAYTFKRGGVSYTARYTLSREPPPVVLPFVFVRRSPPVAECAALAGKGPIIDALEIRRGGSVVSSGDEAYLSSARCPGQGLTNKAPTALNGPNDGNGAALGDAEYGWRLAGKVTLESGDEVAVTVLDASAESFEVFAGPEQTRPTLKLGVLNGSGTVRVP